MPDELITIGYFPKRVATRCAGLKNPGVEEIFSASCCVSDGPEDWINLPFHNELFLFNSESDAWRAVPGGRDNRAFHMFAYRMLPIEFDGGTATPFSAPVNSVQPIPPEYARLGFDVVSCSAGDLFECSPLSCNGRADDLPVNRYCLADSLETAIEFARLFAGGAGCEPGPYFVLEVWRRLAPEGV